MSTICYWRSFSFMSTALVPVPSSLLPSLPPLYPRSICWAESSWSPCPTDCLRAPNGHHPSHCFPRGWLVAIIRVISVRFSSRLQFSVLNFSQLDQACVTVLVSAAPATKPWWVCCFFFFFAPSWVFFNSRKENSERKITQLRQTQNSKIKLKTPSACGKKKSKRNYPL